MLIASARIVSTYSELSLTADEPAHFACGLEYLQKHLYKYETQHPPLARAMAALGPYLYGARLRGHGGLGEEGVDIIVHSPAPQRTVTLMRLGILPFFWLGGAIAFLWARKITGPPIAVLAIGLYTLTPPVLAHAAVATTDMALAACLAASFFTMLQWADSPSWRNSIIWGVATAAAVLSKFTALAFFPAAAALALIFYLAVARPGWNELVNLASKRLAPFLVAVAGGAVVIWAAYWFSFNSLPAPEFFDGIAVAAGHNDRGHPAFLFGSISGRGWWYYFPAALAVKTPAALLVLTVVGIVLCWRFRQNLAYLMPMAFSLGTLFVAMTGNVNIGVRHVLPVYIGFCIVSAVALSHLMQQTARLQWTAAGLVLWAALSGALSHPDYLAYFNESILFTRPEKLLIDSDLDWGQDVIQLSRRLRELGVHRVAFNIYPPVIPMYRVPECVRVDPNRPTETWTVVRPTDATYASAFLYSRRPWYEDREPTERVGAFLLYRSGN
jgi:hypothetical protein